MLYGSAPSASSFTYDPLGRLSNLVVGGGTSTALFDGDDLAAEYAGSSIALRVVPSGLGTNQPLVWFSGPTLIAPLWLHTDNEGSVVAMSNSSGSASPSPPFGYDPFGVPDGVNGFAGPPTRYTGQLPFPSIELYYYKAREYDPTLGRFLQTDPIGLAGDMNLYGYVRDDPLNLDDQRALLKP